MYGYSEYGPYKHGRQVQRQNVPANVVIFPAPAVVATDWTFYLDALWQPPAVFTLTGA